MSNRKSDKFDHQRKAVQQAVTGRAEDSRVLTDADAAADLAGTPRPSTADCQHTGGITCYRCSPERGAGSSVEAEIAADYGLGVTSTPGYAEEQSARNLSATAAMESATPDRQDGEAAMVLRQDIPAPTTNSDGSVALRKLGVGNEFTIRPGSWPVYLAVAADRSSRIVVAHDITPGAKYPTVLHIPDDQNVWPALRPAAEPPKVIVPTVGRKVWFYPGGGMWPAGMQVFPGTDYDGGVQQPLDATIVYVHDDRLVNLRVIDHAGHAFPVRSVQLVQPGDECCGAGHRAEWMPFQVKQAGKA